MFVANFFHVCLASLRSDHNSDSVASLLIGPHVSHMFTFGIVSTLGEGLGVETQDNVL